MGYYEQKAQRDEALLKMLGHIEGPEEPAEPEGPPDFDGGARESVPLQSNPDADHNALILQMLGEHKGGSGVDFWPMAGPARSQPATESGEEPNQGEDWRKGGT